MTTQTITDIERAAATLVARATIVHPVLREWAGKVAADPDYIVRFYDFEPSAEVAQSAAAWGFAPAGFDLDDAIEDGTAFPHTDAVRHHQRARECDTAVMRLAAAIVKHRLGGRVEGDYSIDLHGIGGTFATITTSLAAKVVSYHEAIVHQVYAELEDAKMGIA